MGEAKQREKAIGSSAAPDVSREKLAQLARELLDNGLLVEAGFASLRSIAIPADAPPVQIEQMRMAFFAGAQHTLASVIDMLDPGSEPTPADLRRMGRLYGELDRFVEEFKLKYDRPTGTA